MVHPIFRAPPPRLSHKQRVTRLYRGVLKRFNERFSDISSQQNYTWVLRNQFEQHRHEPNKIKQEELLSWGEERFRYNMQLYPDRYYVPMEKKGSSYQRNTPLPAYFHDPARYLNFDRLDEDLEHLEDTLRKRREEANAKGGADHQHDDHAHGHH